MRYCKKCIQPDTRPGIVFDQEGVCPACRFMEEAPKIDWGKRRKELDALVDFAKKHSKYGYDCLIGVSGGKDSVRQAMFARDELGLKPLLVTCGTPAEQFTERGADNLANLITLGFDTIHYCPAPQVWKALMWEGLTRYGNFLKSAEMALYASSPKIALAYQIPVVFFGENPALTVGELCLGTTNANANLTKGNTIAGGPDTIRPPEMGIEKTIMYRFPSDEDMANCKMRIVYLGYYIEDFGKRKNAEFSIAHGLKVRQDPPEDIGDITGHEALDDDFVVVSQMLKYIKLGFGKVVDQVSEEVRLGSMTRDEAIELARLYDGKCAPRYIEKFCQYFRISQTEFDAIIQQYRNKDIWKMSNGRWQLTVDFDNTPLSIL